MEILKSVILLGVMGLIFGAFLAFAAQKFAVEVDEREAKILEVLNKYTHKDEKLSKYQACQYLNVSRATFDN